eukprot:s1381_g31.t1
MTLPSPATSPAASQDPALAEVWNVLNFAWTVPDNNDGLVDHEEDGSDAPPLLALEDGELDDDDEGDHGNGALDSDGHHDRGDDHDDDGSASITTTQPEQCREDGSFDTQAMDSKVMDSQIMDSEVLDSQCFNSEVEIPSDEYYLSMQCDSQVGTGKTAEDVCPAENVDAVTTLQYDLPDVAAPGIAEGEAISESPAKLEPAQPAPLEPSLEVSGGEPPAPCPDGPASSKPPTVDKNPAASELVSWIF